MNPYLSLTFLSAMSMTVGSALFAEEGAIVKAEFIYKQAPYPSCHASTIVETEDGLMAAWFGGTHEKHPDVGIWVSQTDSAGNWTESTEVANGVQHAAHRHPCWNPVLMVEPHDDSGREGSGREIVHLFYKCGPNPQAWWGMHMTYGRHQRRSEGDSAWSRPRRLPEQIDGPVKNKPVLLTDGTLLCGSSTEYDGWRVHFELTKDWGKTWERVGPINDASEFNAIQPTILTHRDGRLQILCRAKEGNIVTGWSADQGRTWSKLERTSLPNPNSGIDAVTLADGRHLLVYNHTPRGRSPLNIAISSGGVNWDNVLALESEPGEYSYPAVIQTSDGLVHTTYTWKRQRIKHVVVDPSKL